MLIQPMKSTSKEKNLGVELLVKIKTPIITPNSKYTIANLTKSQTSFIMSTSFHEKPNEPVELLVFKFILINE